MSELVLKDSPAQAAVDQLHAVMTALPPVECPVDHVFTAGLYTRKFFGPAGTLVISKIHRTEHPFAVFTGLARVWIEGQGVVEIAAPYLGVTKPGTRRILYFVEDTVWVTFHPTESTDVAEIEEAIIEKRELPEGMVEAARLALLGGDA